MPERFDLTYIGADGEKHRPVMVHRTIFGSIERFMGILIEHFAGAFPTWLSPVQVRILPIADRHIEYAMKIKQELFDDEIRVDVDDRNEKVGFKIREAQAEKIPYMLIVGDKEMESGNVSYRTREAGDQGSISTQDFHEMVAVDIRSKRNPLTCNT
jgi:threonyl-tRNA synthetase